MAPEPNIPELRMDPAGLYREEAFTDRHAGLIRRLSPVKPDGAPDPDREVIYVGEAQLLTPVGAIPVAFEIEARSIGEAAQGFAEAARAAVERTLQELEALRREAASSLVIPDRMPPGLGGPGLGGPGLGGPPGGRRGGRIQLP
jgi:hypothetical protein